MMVCWKWNSTRSGRENSASYRDMVGVIIEGDSRGSKCGVAVVAIE